MRILSNTLQNFAGKSEKKKKKNGTVVGQVSSKSNLRELSLSQKMFLNRSICMIITSALPGGHGVMGLEGRRIKTKNILLKAVGQTSKAQKVRKCALPFGSDFG
jgi:hypothetical protein